MATDFRLNVILQGRSKTIDNEFRVPSPHKRFTSGQSVPAISGGSGTSTSGEHQPQKYDCLGWFCLSACKMMPKDAL